MYVIYLLSANSVRSEKAVICQPKKEGNLVGTKQGKCKKSSGLDQLFFSAQLGDDASMISWAHKALSAAHPR